MKVYCDVSGAALLNVYCYVTTMAGASEAFEVGDELQRIDPRIDPRCPSLPLRLMTFGAGWKFQGNHRLPFTLLSCAGQKHSADGCLKTRNICGCL